MKGELTVILRSSDTKKVVDTRVYKNVVVDGMRKQVCKMLAGVITENFPDRMQFGTGTMPETVSDTALQMPITPVKSISTVYFPPTEDYVVQFTTFLRETEANGFPITEAGCLCGDGTLATRKVFATIEKTVDFVVEFRWRITA